MNKDVTYQKLNDEERGYLSNFCKKKWMNIFKGLAITYSLPIIIAIVIWVYLDSIELYGWFRFHNSPHYIYPKSMSQFWDYFSLNAFVWFPAFILITIANCAYILISLPKIYIDKVRNVKKIISFYPEPYYVPENGKYYIKASIDEINFFEISYESFLTINDKETLLLEMLPTTKLYLDLRKADDGKSIKTNYSIT